MVGMDRRARLAIVTRPARFFSVMPIVRGAALAALSLTVMLGTVHWFKGAERVGALAFTPRVVGTATQAVGVKDVRGYDLNEDGKIDIITAGDDGVKVYENLGEWKFAVHVVDDKPAERVLVADLDKDSNADLVVSLLGNSPSVRWYDYQGISSFEFTGRTIATAGADALVGVGDLDADGWLDLATVSGREVRVLERWMNNGNGTFAATTLNSDTKATSLAVGDIIRNGYADIVTGGTAGLQRWSSVNGTSWTRVDIDDSNQNRSHLVMADAPNGSAWIATGDTNDDEVVLYRSGLGVASAGQFGKKFIDTAADAKSVAVADLDTDGDLDILATGQDANEVYWYENDGLDIFSKHTLATNLQSVFGVAAADLDNDGDLDVITGDQMRGTVFAYERLRKKPTATAPTSIQQSSNGAGLVTFSTTVADDDKDWTRLRVQYSIDGAHWYKPWLTKVVVDKGKVDLLNREGYQVGTKNSIDTDANEAVTIMLTWDTKSSENTGGPLITDLDSVRLRVIPRDNREVGVAAASGKFQVDNGAPKNFTLKLAAITSNDAGLVWTKPSEISDFSYQLYYGTDAKKVLDRKSDIWVGTDEASLADINTTATTVTGLAVDKLYTFKLFAIDEFGNIGATASVQGKTVEPVVTAAPGDSTPAPTGSADPTSSLAPTLAPGETPAPTSEIQPTSTPIIFPTPTVPPVLQSNTAPVADGGPDQVVNSRALVIIDGTASFDPDPGDSATLVYSWRQIDGPKVDLLSERTATPSFSAGNENETYIFSLTTRDVQGASAIDTVTVATKALPASEPIDVAVDTQQPAPNMIPIEESSLVSLLLKPADLFLLALSLLSSAILLIDRLSHVLGGGRAVATLRPAVARSGERAQSRVVHYRTGDPIAGAQVLVYGEDGKLRAQERTNAQGAFASFFPSGVYTLAVRMEGFSFAPEAAKSVISPDSILYSGGKVTVKDVSHPPSIIIPMKPTGGEVTNIRARLLRVWQTVQHTGRLLSWPLFLAGAILNTILVFLAPSLLYLVIEVIYIVLVIVKIAVEIRMRPAYGMVRDAITHIPLELAVVRLFEQGSNRLIMTRVTNNQGKFFALPPAGTYTITISKPGYGTFTRERVEIVSDHDTTLQMTADLMPVAPQLGVGNLTRARAATL